jgi:hypothetical protein
MGQLCLYEEEEEEEEKCIFNEIIATCEYHAIDKIMAFQYN